MNTGIYNVYVMYAAIGFLYIGALSLAIWLAVRGQKLNSALKTSKRDVFVQLQDHLVAHSNNNRELIRLLGQSTQEKRKLQEDFLKNYSPALTEDFLKSSRLSLSDEGMFIFTCKLGLWTAQATTYKVAERNAVYNFATPYWKGEYTELLKKKEEN